MVTPQHWTFSRKFGFKTKRVNMPEETISTLIMFWPTCFSFFPPDVEGWSKKHVQGPVVGQIGKEFSLQTILWGENNLWFRMDDEKREFPGLFLPCNFFSVSQNFCNSVKYLSRMNTLEIPSAVEVMVKVQSASSSQNGVATPTLIGTSDRLGDFGMSRFGLRLEQMREGKKEFSIFSNLLRSSSKARMDLFNVRGIRDAAQGRLG